MVVTLPEESYFIAVFAPKLVSWFGAPYVHAVALVPMIVFVRLPARSYWNTDVTTKSMRPPASR
jgi:hypothetical protein